MNCPGLALVTTTGSAAVMREHALHVFHYSVHFHFAT